MPTNEAMILSKIDVQRACVTFHQEKRRGCHESEAQFHITMEDAHETVIQRLLAQLRELRNNNQYM